MSRFSWSESALSKADIKRMQDTARDKMDEMVDVLKTMPRSLVLVIRNLNLLRSLNRELGAPVNRFTVMARTALHSQARLATSHTSIWRAVHFEIRLQWISLLNWAQDTVVVMLRRFGYLPSNLGALEEYIMPA